MAPKMKCEEESESWIKLEEKRQKRACHELTTSNLTLKNDDFKCTSPKKVSKLALSLKRKRTNKSSQESNYGTKCQEEKQNQINSVIVHPADDRKNEVKSGHELRNNHSVNETRERIDYIVSDQESRKLINVVIGNNYPEKENQNQLNSTVGTSTYEIKKEDTDNQTTRINQNKRISLEKTEKITKQDHIKKTFSGNQPKSVLRLGLSRKRRVNPLHCLKSI